LILLVAKESRMSSSQSSRSRWDDFAARLGYHRFLDEVRDATVQVVPRIRERKVRKEVMSDE